MDFKSNPLTKQEFGVLDVLIMDSSFAKLYSAYRVFLDVSDSLTDQKYIVFDIAQIDYQVTPLGREVYNLWKPFYDL